MHIKRLSVLVAMALVMVVAVALTLGLTAVIGAPPGGPPLPVPYLHSADFSVITVGSGNPQPSTDRASSCTVIQYEGKYYVVDAGSGAIQSFLRMQADAAGTTGLAYQDIAAFLFTHRHMDHQTDFFDLMMNRWMTGGKAVDIVGPPGTSELHKFLISYWKDDLVYRMAREGGAVGVTEMGMFTGVTVTELKRPASLNNSGMLADPITLGPLSVKAFELTHTMYDLGYRFTAPDGKVIAVTGDTSADPDLVELAAGADILVTDCVTRPNQVWPAPDPTPSPYNPTGRWQGNFDVNAHILAQDLVNAVEEAQPTKVVITHLPPTLAQAAVDFVKDMFAEIGYHTQDDSDFDDVHELIFATDGLEIIP